MSGETAAERLSPVQVSGLASGVTSIGAGDYHTCAIQANGTRVCWGQERSGKLGAEDDGILDNPPTVPVEVVWS